MLRPPTPELDKLRAHGDTFKTLLSFIAWLEEESNVQLYRDDSPVYRTGDLVLQYLEVDPKERLKELDALLEYQASLTEGDAPR